ncbi:hypothetical protein ACOJR9_18805 [Alteromonas sp. A081]|uniref:hypothetical protein n=1 Tax=Alteromonas sp. A081 TaxID=3410269 RepID=UPI003B985921
MKSQNITLVLYPIILLCILMIVHIFIGTISVPIPSANAQRDFNTALGISLLTCYFLFAIRYIHKKVAQNLEKMLEINRQYQNFYYHRSKISRKFKQHLVWSTSIGFIMPIVYMVAENVITRINEPEVFFIAVTAIPFWVLTSLFCFQVLTNNQYLRTLSMAVKSESLSEQILVLQNLLTFGLNTALTLLFAMGIMPVFWVNQPVHGLDITVIFVFGASFSLIVLWPMLQIIRQLKVLSQQLIANNDQEITTLIQSGNSHSESRKIEQLLNEVEKFKSPLTRSHALYLILCLLPLPFSWVLLSLVELSFKY